MAMSDLPQDLVEEVLSRVPLTSLKAVRTTCKNWNTLSKHRSFTKKHIRKSRDAMKTKKELLAITILDFKVYLMSVNLHGTHNDDDVETSINPKGKLISLKDADGVGVSIVFHCSGLLLCNTREKYPRLVVLNPYHGHTRWIKLSDHRDMYWDCNMYALGYAKKEKSRRFKILRYKERASRFINIIGNWGSRFSKYEIYNFKSDSWKDINLTPGNIRFYKRGVSLKGNTYWLARTNPDSPFHRPALGTTYYFFLLCFDFAAERFGPRLPLSSHYHIQDTVSLSSARNKQLAVLYQKRDTLKMEIWITTKIQPGAVSWTKLFLSETVNMKALLTLPVDHESSFFVDEEKKFVVVFGKDKEMRDRNVAYIIGEDGYFKKLDLGELTDKNGCPFGCFYVPSSEEIKQPTSYLIN